MLEPPVSPLLLPRDSPLYQQLMTLAAEKRLVFFAGLPGTGKSLWIHQLTHMAAAAGRKVQLLQWDVVRPGFEAHPAAQRYPLEDGVTHAVIRLAIGRWARRAVADWHRQHAEPQAMLIGETPFIGHRLIELARVADDAAEALLRQPGCVFVLPVPSPPVRDHIEAERRRRTLTPVHTREQEDAPPHLLQALWQELRRIAPCLGVNLQEATNPLPYDPTVYRSVYQALLRHRHVEILWCETVLPTATFSVYALASQPHFLTPDTDEVQRCIQDVEREYHPDESALQHAMARWYVV
jgi:hypothetical protein